MLPRPASELLTNLSALSIRILEKIVISLYPINWTVSSNIQILVLIVALCRFRKNRNLDILIDLVHDVDVRVACLHDSKKFQNHRSNNLLAAKFGILAQNQSDPFRLIEDLTEKIRIASATFDSNSVLSQSCKACRGCLHQLPHSHLHHIEFLLQKPKVKLTDLGLLVLIKEC